MQRKLAKHIYEGYIVLVDVNVTREQQSCRVV
jgi:hypothetical protein